MQELIRSITEDQLKQDIPLFRAGDTLRVHVKVKRDNVNGFSFLKEL